MAEVNTDATEATAADALLTTAEIARSLRVGRRTVNRWITAYGLPAISAGRAWRVKAADLNAWLDSHPLRKK